MQKELEQSEGMMGFIECNTYYTKPYSTFHLLAPLPT